ncbi:2942_t:CDS:2, partial [Dentiscutata heterogama]
KRKNIQRKINNHKKFGRKGDGVFRLHKGHLEFGAIEASRNWKEINEVASRLTNSKPLALVLKEVLYAQSIIIATMDIIDKKDDLKIETFLDDSNDRYHTLPTNITMNIFTTPNKSRTKDMINEIKNSVKITIP